MAVFLINFCGWPSKIFHVLLKFWWNHFLHLPENLLLNRSIHYVFLKRFSVTKLYTEFFLKLCKNLFMWIAVSLVIFTYLAKSHLVLNYQYVRKLFSLGYICRYEFSFIKIILINWWKLTFLYQLFSKFRENVTWPMKTKSAISAKMFSKKTPYGLCVESDNRAYFWWLHNRFHKNNYMKKSPGFNRIVRHI